MLITSQSHEALLDRSLCRVEIYLFWFRLGNSMLIISSLVLFAATLIERVLVDYYEYSTQQLAISALLFIAAVSGIIGTRRLRRDLNQDKDGKRTCAQRKLRLTSESASMQTAREQ